VKALNAIFWSAEMREKAWGTMAKPDKGREKE